MRTLVVFLLSLCALAIKAQQNQPFPELTGESLEGNARTLPDDTKGKLTLVGLAYSEKAEDALNTWLTPVYDKFVLKRGMFDATYDVNVVFVPMYIGLKQAAYEPTMKKLRESNRKDLYPYILFYKGELEPYGSMLGMNDKSTPYFFVLDKNGKVIHSVSGMFSDTKMEKIEEVLDKYGQ